MPPFIYTTDQKIWIVKQLLCGHSARKVRDLFAVEFPESPIPSLHTVQICLQRFNQFGCLNNDHKHILQKKREKYLLTEEVQTRICASVEENPNITSREIAVEMGISKTSVLKTLKDAGYHQQRESVISTDGKKNSFRVWSRGNPFEIVTVEYGKD